MNQGQENVTVNQTNTPAQKSKVCAGILGILLG